MVSKVTRKNPKAVEQALDRYRDASKKKLAVGWPLGTQSVGLRYPDGTSVLMVAAANNFGAEIDHPGGTKYVIGADGKAHFVSNDHTGAVAGVTKPHKINIPARPFMRHATGPATEAMRLVSRETLPLINEGKITGEEVLKIAGPTIEALFKKSITDLRDPPNRPSTIREKGSDNPLINTGLLRNSLTHHVRGAE